MAREIAYTITVDDTEGKAKVAAFEKEATSAGAGLGKTSKALGEYEAKVATVAKSQSVATAALTTYTTAARVAGAQSTAMGVQMSGVAGVLFTQAAAADTATVATGGLSAMLGRASASVVGFVGTVAGVVSAMAPWLVAIMAVVEGLKYLIERQGQAALAAETAAAKQDTINRAIELGANKTIKYGDAIEFLNEKQRNALAMNPEQAANAWVKALSARTAAAIKAGAEEQALTDGLAARGIVMGETLDVEKMMTEATEKAAQAAKKAAEEHEKLTAAVSRVEGVVPGLRVQIGTLDDTTVKSVKSFVALMAQMREMEAVSVPARRQTSELVETMQDLGEEVDISSLGIQNWIDSWTFVGPTLDMVKGKTMSVGQQIRSAMSDIGSILDGINNKWAQMTAVIARTGDAIMRNLSEGNILGAVVSGITGAFTAIKNLFSDVEKQVNPVRQAFVDLAGGLDALNLRAYNAGVTLDALLDARTPEAYKKAIDDLTAAFEFQDRALEQVAEAAERWNINTDLMGPAWDRQQLEKKAQDLFTDYSVLIGAGVDQVEVTQKMSAAVSDYLNRALALGMEIPESMRPMLQRFADMGDLIDANGNKITDLSDIPFAETMSQGFSRVVDAVEKLVAAIERGLNPAILNIPNRTVYIDYEERGAKPNGGETQTETFHAGGIVMHAGGLTDEAWASLQRAHTGLAVDEVPIIAQRGEGILSRRDMAALGGNAGFRTFRQQLHAGNGAVATGPSMATVETLLKSLLVSQQQQEERAREAQRLQPTLLANALRDMAERQRPRA